MLLFFLFVLCVVIPKRKADYFLLFLRFLLLCWYARLTYPSLIPLPFVISMSCPVSLSLHRHLPTQEIHSPIPSSRINFSTLIFRGQVRRGSHSYTNALQSLALSPDRVHARGTGRLTGRSIGYHCAVLSCRNPLGITGQLLGKSGSGRNAERWVSGRVYV